MAQSAQVSGIKSAMDALLRGRPRPAPEVLDAMDVTSIVISGVLSLVTGYVWIMIAVWLAYGILWLGQLVPGVRFVLSRATLTRRYRRYQGPDGSGDANGT